jgi:hypothetical protein
MSRDKDLIFEKYTKDVLVVEFPVYASSSYTDPTRTLPVPSNPEHGGAGYAIGTYANEVKQDPYDVALEIAAKVKTELFKPGTYFFKGSNYDLEFEGDRDELEKQIHKLIEREFTARGYPPYFRQAKNAARVIAGQVINVAQERGGLRQPGVTTPKPVPQKVVVTNSQTIDDVFERIFKMKISHGLVFDIKQKYTIDPSAFGNNPDLFKDTEDNAILSAACRALIEHDAEADHWAGHPTNALTYHGASLVNVVHKKLNTPYTETKRLLTELLKYGCLVKA